MVDFTDPVFSISAQAEMLSLNRTSLYYKPRMGYGDRNEKLEKALDLCTSGEGNMEVGFLEGQHTADEFVEYLIRTIHSL